MGAVKPLWCVRSQLNAPLGIVADVLQERGVPWRYVDPWRSQTLPDVGEVGGLVLLGGGMNVDAVDRHPWLADVRDLSRASVDAGLPVLGVCLGAQVLARAAGATVVPSAVREIGFLPVSITDAGRSDPVLSALAPAATVFQFHEDRCELPAGADLLATGVDVEVQAFRVGERAYGVQFHFEVTAAEVAAWCDEVGAAELRDVWGTSKDALVAQAGRHLPAQQRAGRTLVRSFLDLSEPARKGAASRR